MTSRMTPCAIFDIDGTLSDATHRLHLVKNKPKNYDKFYEGIPHDTPYEPICDIARNYLCSRDMAVVFITARPEKTRQDTVNWLHTHVSTPLNVNPFLFMRKDEDYRPAAVVKEELLDGLLRNGLDPKIAFEDCPSVCKMYVRRGILVARIDTGEWDDA